MSDLSKLFEQLADGPVLLATAFASVNTDCDMALPFVVSLDAKGAMRARLIV